MSALVGIDVGTGGSRALAVNESGEVLAEESVEYSLYSPPPAGRSRTPRIGGER
jgi:sugar (pentulose or hexulose) kinase